MCINNKTKAKKGFYEDKTILQDQMDIILLSSWINYKNEIENSKINTNDTEGDIWLYISFNYSIPVFCCDIQLTPIS